MGELDTDFISHEITLIVLSNALLRSFFTVEFDKTIANFQFDVDYIANFSKATLKVFPARMFRQAANVDLIRLYLFFAALRARLPVRTSRGIRNSRFTAVSAATVVRILGILGHPVIRRRRSTVASTVTRRTHSVLI